MFGSYSKARVGIFFNVFVKIVLLIELYLFNTHIQGVTCDVGYAPNRFKLRIRIHSYAIRVWLLNSYITNKTW